MILQLILNCQAWMCETGNLAESLCCTLHAHMVGRLDDNYSLLQSYPKGSNQGSNFHDHDGLYGGYSGCSVPAIMIPLTKLVGYKFFSLLEFKCISVIHSMVEHQCPKDCLQFVFSIWFWSVIKVWVSQQKCYWCLKISLTKALIQWIYNRFIYRL